MPFWGMVKWPPIGDWLHVADSTVYVCHFCFTHVASTDQTKLLHYIGLTLNLRNKYNEYNLNFH